MEEKQKYLDEGLSFEQRAEDLVSRMTLEECAATASSLWRDSGRRLPNS